MIAHKEREKKINGEKGNIFQKTLRFYVHRFDSNNERCSNYPSIRFEYSHNDETYTVYSLKIMRVLKRFVKINSGEIAQ